MSKRNVAVRITPDAVRQVRGGSPWVFDGSIDSVTFDAEPGTTAILFDRKREFVGVGLYDPFSPIRVRVLQFGERVQVGETLLRQRIVAAVARRDAIRDQVDGDGAPLTTGYRLIHGENDGMPGLVVDRFGGTLVMKWYTIAWNAHLDTLVEILVDLLAPTAVVLRLGRTVKAHARTVDAPTDGTTVYGDSPPAPVEFRESGWWFEADVVHGQKTGHFLDQRDNRQRVGALAAESNVLDVFSSTGGFSVAAVGSGARSVALIDQSTHALAAARRNLARNFDAGTERLSGVAERATMIVGDAFAELQRLANDRASFDLVVVDPPSFAHNQAAVPQAIAAYQRLTGLALAVLGPGGILVQCSCSSRVTNDAFFDAVLDAAEQAGRPLGEIERTFHALDHPVGFEHGAYLKALFAFAP